jgi:NIMA (never in mitosis gene a)-related kinase
LNVKIGDMGVAKKLSRSNFAKTIIGTPYYLSPEICEEKPYNEKSDIWALGCILYELCTFNHPFNAKSQGALVLKILNNNPTPIKKTYNENLQKLVNVILEKNFYKRPSCKTILKFPYIIEKIKKFKMIEQYQSIGLKITTKNNLFKKINIKRAKININDDENSSKKNKNNIKNDKNNCLTSNEDRENKNNINFTKRHNPWAEDFFKKKNDTNNKIDRKMLKKDINNHLKDLTNCDFRKKNNNSFITNLGKINMLKNKSKKNINKNDKSPLHENKYKNNKKISNKEASKSVQNNIKKDKEGKKNKVVKNKVVKIDLTNTLELNQIINNYLDKGDNLRESKNLENIKEFANNLNNYFSENMISNNNYNNKNSPPLILTNKDNNIEQNSETKEQKNEKNDSNNKKEHKEILNYDCDRITSNKMGINSYDELIKDFSGSRGPTVANKLDNNSSNDNKKSITPFEYQIIKNSNINNEHNSNDINKRESEFQVFDNNNNNYNNLNNKDNNLCESDDDLKFNNININNVENDNSDKDNSGEENVKTIMNFDNDNKNILNNNMDEKERILEDKKLLTDRLESIKKEMFNLIGENDYKYVMELYSIIDKTKIDEIYVKIEEYVQKYDEDKKDKFDILYFKLISTDCQVQQKNNELQKLLFSDF